MRGRCIRRGKNVATVEPGRRDLVAASCGAGDDARDEPRSPRDGTASASCSPGADSA